ncbi:hypothetical protein [Nonomuraea sp. NPDC049480]|uniref:hypothetical protein n=1 Tax=Nonomuraea sp. NPDC049480 TaxID=3364353 RepID=UPI0037921213
MFTLETARLQLRPFTREEASTSWPAPTRAATGAAATSADQDIAQLVLQAASAGLLFGPLQIVLLGSLVHAEISREIITVARRSGRPVSAATAP